eukprot:TRINITY_DN7599_c0_g1_i1.p1 TRINITY_DN7599_c0_g1~~TRINITY_DN7599_c0_g1_i1.p1  ORF type:complete len:224 (-),score=69.91 TRINITY_DN7599_c0_g1_i1:366-1037(-)
MSNQGEDSAPTAVIKFHKGSEKYQNLRESFIALKKGSSRRQVDFHILQLSEDIFNMFDSPFPFITIRNVFPEEELISVSRQAEETQMHDFFQILDDIDSHDEDRDEKKDKGYVFLGFKVPRGNEDCTELDRSWRVWSGIKEIVADLSKLDVDTSRVTFYKSARKVQKPDLFMYMIIIHIYYESKPLVKDFLQKHRISKRSGYAAFYVPWSETGSFDADTFLMN